MQHRHVTNRVTATLMDAVLRSINHYCLSVLMQYQRHRTTGFLKSGISITDMNVWLILEVGRLIDHQLIETIARAGQQTNVTEDGRGLGTQ